MTRQQPQWVKLYDNSWGVRLDHALASPGDVVTVNRKDGASSDETLKECLSEGATWSIWRVGAPEIPAPPKHPPQARRPLIRRGSTLIRPAVVRPEPPPPSDADAPPDVDD